MQTPSLTRRDFVKASTLLAAGTALSGPSFAQDSAPRRRGIKLGMDNFSVRAMNWKAPQLLDYAASLKTDSIFITDLAPFEKRDDAYLGEIRKMAADKGIQIWLGSWSICPTSRAFKKDWGTAEEHLALGLRMSKALGSPAFRVVLGTGDDRKTEGGIEARIADTVKVLKSQRSLALDSGVKVAIENHAGDMQSWELVNLIEAAGKDFVGANMDSGNALWTLEDPLLSLDILGPDAITTSLRDGAVWETANGASVQWTAMGAGMVDWKTYFDRFEKLCPGVAVHIETISGANRNLPYSNPEFWSVWPKARASDLARFVAMAKKGTPRTGGGRPREQTEQEYQKSEIEKSIAYFKTLGLGPA